MNDVHFDFAVLLTLLALITGIGWVLDKLWLAPRRSRTVGQHEDRPSWPIEICRSFFPVIAVVLLLRSFVAEPFRIPSGSMIPTLLIGDFILVNKFSYGLRDPVFHHKFLDTGEPKRGDIAVFRYPNDPRVDYIKRIIGLPGDHISYREKILYINGEPMAQTPDGVFTASGLAPTYRLEENLSGVEHAIIINPNRRGEPVDHVEDFIVPEGQYYAMGDNRDGSADSRYWGTVPEGNLVGRAFLIWMSWDSARHRPLFSRIGMRVR